MIEVQPTMVSPSAIEIVSMDQGATNEDGGMNHAQESNNTGACVDVLKITPQVVIGKIVGSTNSLDANNDVMSETDPTDVTSKGSLVIAIVPKSLENRKSFHCLCGSTFDAFHHLFRNNCAGIVSSIRSIGNVSSV